MEDNNTREIEQLEQHIVVEHDRKTNRSAKQQQSTTQQKGYK